jgi:hypothetical protein
MLVPPPLFELAVGELRLVNGLGRPAQPGPYADAWKRFGQGGREAVACDRVVLAAAPATVRRPAPAEAPRPRKRRGLTSAKARHCQKVKQHNRRLAQRQADQGEA